MSDDQNDIYDVGPEPPPAAEPAAKRADEVPSLTWRPVKDVATHERYTASDRVFYLLRRLAGIPMMLVGIWWIWHCVGGISIAMTMMPGGRCSRSPPALFRSPSDYSCCFTAGRANQQRRDIVSDAVR